MRPLVSGIGSGPVFPSSPAAFRAAPSENLGKCVWCSTSFTRPGPRSKVVHPRRRQRYVIDCIDIFMIGNTGGRRLVDGWRTKSEREPSPCRSSTLPDADPTQEQEHGSLGLTHRCDIRCIYRCEAQAYVRRANALVIGSPTYRL